MDMRLHNPTSLHHCTGVGDVVNFARLLVVVFNSCSVTVSRVWQSHHLRTAVTMGMPPVTRKASLSRLRDLDSQDDCRVPSLHRFTILRLRARAGDTAGVTAD